MKEFDLNIGRILDNWEIHHAIREIIANALDEQILTNTPEIQIFKESDIWYICDFGRGLNYHHLTQNENPEKIENDKVIGRFGVGLKDALATLFRNNIRVEIYSKYGVITLKETTKSFFDDIVTLHAQIDSPTNSKMCGTTFRILGCPDYEIDYAKNMFLKFSNPKIIETTSYGQIIDKKSDVASIYINGVKVAEEPNFAFSYNITSLSKQIKKALNRERSNVGRTAYADRIKSILLDASSSSVLDVLSDNLEAMSDGTQCDEIKWVDVAAHVVKVINDSENTVFMTPSEFANNSGKTNEILGNSGKRIVFISESVKNKAGQESENEITTIEDVVKEYNDSFSYDFVEEEELTEAEKANWNTVPSLLENLGLSFWFEKCFISEQLKINEDNTVGVWDKDLQKIIILRSQLKNVSDLYGTIIHEIIHASTETSDISRDFESELTRMIGNISSRYMLKEEGFYGTNKKQLIIDFELPFDDSVCCNDIDIRRLALLSISGDVYWCDDCFNLMSVFTKQLLEKRKDVSRSERYDRKIAVYIENDILYFIVYDYSKERGKDFLYVATVEDLKHLETSVSCTVYDGAEIALLRDFMTIKSEITVSEYETSKVVTYDGYLQVVRKLLLMAEESKYEEDVWNLAESRRCAFNMLDEDLDNYIDKHICPVCGCYFTSYETKCIKCGSEGMNID